MKNKLGKFVTFEGVEGSGKTTQLELLHTKMKSSGVPVLATREPGGTELGKGLRDILLFSDKDSLDMGAELLLYEADRIQHVKEVIFPALERGINVLCDRFFDSTTAYQVYGRGLDFNLVDNINKFASCGLEPDLTFLLQIPVSEGLKRANSGGLADRLENEDIEFHKRVQNGFLKIASKNPERFALIRDGKNISSVHIEISKIISKVFKWF
ncbi:MAG: dTMP kinase [Nitrospinota bacterium]|nr:dTMP kinase [Nitrospinota bacterium]